MALACGVLAVRAHERVGAVGAPHAPDHARGTLVKIAQWFLDHQGPALPAFQRMPRFSSALFLGDFFETPSAVQAVFAPMAEAGVSGHLVQVVDPAEETLPMRGASSSRKWRGR